MKRALALLLLGACGNDRPPLLNPEGGDVPVYDAMYIQPREGGLLVDAGSTESGTATVYMDYEGTCQNGYRPVWRFHDFKTTTPGGSAISFWARSASSIGALDTAQSVILGTVSGPDIVVWTGIDVDPKLRSIGEQSLLFLRVTTILQLGEAGAPTLVDWRQQYDCVVNQ